MSATEYLGLAGLLMLSERNIKYPDDRKQLARLFEETYQWKCDEDVVARLVKQLEKWGAIIVSDDRFAGETFRVFESNLREARSDIRNSKLNYILKSAEYGGSPWFKKVFAHQEFWTELYNERDDPVVFPEPINLDISDFSESVPAADRVVSRADNYETLGEIDRSLAEVAKEIETNNEVGASLGDLRDVLDLEIEIARTVIEKPKFRLSSLMGWLMPALRFLMEKFASSAVGEAAKHLVSLLEKLF